MTDSTAALSSDEFASLTEIGKGKAQGDIPQAHGERLVDLGYVIRRLGELELTSSGTRRLAAGQ
ncbi:hypothetical protein [Bradyrhizobium sp. MOS003]|jgi:hypothetical protein|uniref:hypothetical protein n=1 Tax=Bradyrhizobium sp. MOS003 TaxID=2133946 RepID=UPI000D1225FA|nr:hypothetical protein [Bradyrhizobium sp. MOS003]PSO18855.1 hypothetical protein C7G42_10985 [Bradyrhizobium sp. MOS003]